MRKSRFSEEQIATALRQVEAGAPVAQVARRMVSARRPSTFGRNSTRICQPLSCVRCYNCGRRTSSSNGWSRT
jgi:hypothetical protein